MKASLPLGAARYLRWAMPRRIVQPAADDPAQTVSSPSRALDLSRSRTHDAVLDILKAYKLSGNFHVNLDAVLKDMGICDKLTYRIEPTLAFPYPDRRHVAFKPNENVPGDVFAGIVRSIKARIGFEEPWWGRLFRHVKDNLTQDRLRCAQPILRAAAGAERSIASRPLLKTSFRLYGSFGRRSRIGA
jgi:hypothetical protein